MAAYHQPIKKLCYSYDILYNNKVLKNVHLFIPYVDLSEWLVTSQLSNEINSQLTSDSLFDVVFTQRFHKDCTIAPSVLNNL